MAHTYERRYIAWRNQSCLHMHRRKWSLPHIDLLLHTNMRSVDTVISTLVLCSVHHQEDILDIVYGWLKPGVCNMCNVNMYVYRCSWCIYRVGCNLFCGEQKCASYHVCVCMWVTCMLYLERMQTFSRPSCAFDYKALWQSWSVISALLLHYTVI